MKPYIISAKPPIGDELWMFVRPLEISDFKVSDWSDNTNSDLDSWRSPSHVFSVCVLEFSPEIQQELAAYPHLANGMFSSPRIPYGHMSREFRKIHYIVEIMEPVRYQGARNEKEKIKRYLKARDALRQKIRDEGEAAVLRHIAEFNDEIERYLSLKRDEYKFFIVNWASSVETYKDLDVCADTEDMVKRIADLRREVDEIGRAVHQKRSAYLLKIWENDDHDFPDEVVQAICKRLRNEGVACSRTFPVF